MASRNSWQYLVTILAKVFPRSWQDLAKILLRYPWRVDPGMQKDSIAEIVSTLQGQKTPNGILIRIESRFFSNSKHQTIRKKIEIHSLFWFLAL